MRRLNNLQDVFNMWDHTSKPNITPPADPAKVSTVSKSRDDDEAGANHQIRGLFHCPYSLLFLADVLTE